MHGFRQKKKTILSNLSITIAQGEVFWFLWSNGAGKTTTIKCILGLLPLQKGHITRNQKPINQKNVTKIWYAPDQTRYYPHLTGIQNVLAIWYYSWIKKIDLHDQARQLGSMLWLDLYSNNKVKNYSEWMKKKLGLIISLLNEPDLIIRDEPMNWLDPLGRIAVKKLINKLHKKNKTILFSTHILSDVEEVATSYGILHQWKILARGNVSQIKEPLEDFFIKTLQEHHTIL